MGCFTSELKRGDSIDSQSSKTEFKYADGRRFHNVKNVIYALPNDDDEQDRLHLQHFLIRYLFQSNFSAPIENILSESDSKILDVGCGAASWSFDMATTYPSADVIGIDISSHQPTQIKPKNFTFIKGNVLDGLPFEDNTFDFVFHRFLTASHPKHKWPYVVNELVRVLKPGGFLELCEFSNLFDVGPVNQRLWYTAAKVMEEKGIDWDTYQKLEEYAQNQGQLVNIKKEAKQCYYGAKTNNIELSKVAISNISTLYNSLKPLLMKTLNISDYEYDELVKASKDELFEFDSY
ncbi:6685_t:CDS:2, partial [Cetraspora pellucida]